MYFLGRTLELLKLLGDPWEQYGRQLQLNIPRKTDMSVSAVLQKHLGIWNHANTAGVQAIPMKSLWLVWM